MILLSIIDNKLDDKILELKKKCKDLEEKITKIEDDKGEKENYETLD